MSTPDTPPLPPTPGAPAPRKRGRWFWPLQIVPPLLLLLLLTTDNGPGFFFTVLFLGLFALAGVLSIVLRIGFLLFRRGDWRRLLRPVLTVAIVAVAFGYAQKSLHEVRDVVAAEAARIQAQCTRLGKCPDAIAIGTGDPGSSRRHVGTPSTHLHWPISYTLTDTGFVLELHATMDTTQRWIGGPGSELQFEDLIEGRPAGDFDD
jgi:hypothetical protein